MIIKVCGLKYAQNLLDISALNIDMVGYNFYPMSPRYVDQALPLLPSNIQKVGVFVNASTEEIKTKIKDYHLDFVQLHGEETLAFTKLISETIPVIKVFRIDEKFDIQTVEPYTFCHYLLFDTATQNFGGSGLKFNWDLLHTIELDTPFLLSGGIGPNDIHSIQSFIHPHFTGIDINSKFETRPGFKDVSMVRKFIDELNH